MQKPSAVSEKETTSIMPQAARNPASFHGIPTSGAIARKMMPGIIARIVPPSTLPRTIAILGTGATSTDCRKPSLRSSMIEIVEKIAVESKMKSTVPGKKNCKNVVPAGIPSKWKLRPIPAPRKTQNKSGVKKALVTRCRCRRKRTSSRRHSDAAGSRMPPLRGCGDVCSNSSEVGDATKLPAFAISGKSSRLKQECDAIDCTASQRVSFTLWDKMPQAALTQERVELIAGLSHRKETACNLNQHEDDDAKKHQPRALMDKVADALPALFCRHVTPTTLGLIFQLPWQRRRLLRVHLRKLYV